MIGEQGTAKTIMMQAFLSHYDAEVHLHKSINFSSATTPFSFQVYIPPSFVVLVLVAKTNIVNGRCTFYFVMYHLISFVSPDI